MAGDGPAPYAALAENLAAASTSHSAPFNHPSASSSRSSRLPASTSEGRNTKTTRRTSEQLLSTAGSQFISPLVANQGTVNAGTAQTRHGTFYTVPTATTGVNGNEGGGSGGNWGGSVTASAPFTVITQNNAICVSYLSAKSIPTTSTSIPAAYASEESVYAGVQTFHKTLKPRSASTFIYITPAQTTSDGGGYSTSPTTLIDGTPFNEIPLCTDAAADASPVSTFSPENDPETTDSASAASRNSAQVDRTDRGLSSSQRGGLAAGIVIGFILLVVSVIWLIRRRAMRRRITGAQASLWRWSGDEVGGGGSNGSGGSAGTQDVRQNSAAGLGPMDISSIMPSDPVVREVLYGPGSARFVPGNFR